MASRTRQNSLGIGLFFTSAAILMLEICLTRVFSVMMWYHFAFFTISVALFGFAASGLTVHLLPRIFTEARARLTAAAGCVALAIAAPACFEIFALNPKLTYLSGALLKTTEGGGLTVATIFGVGLLFLTAVIPFFFGGLVLAVVFRHYGSKASRLYFFDLLGGGLGCLAAILVLDYFGGPGSMLVVSILAAIGALWFLSGQGNKVFHGAVVALTVLAVILSLTNAKTGLLHLKYFRGQEQNDIAFEDWNSFSRVAVRDAAATDSLLIEIDAASNTWVPHWDGRLQSVPEFADDLISVQYIFFEKPKVLAIGVGGGSDILASLVSSSDDITGVEVNPIIIDIMQNRFADYSGNTYNNPAVRIVKDEARSYIRRSPEKYDVIQAGYVDTYAATAAGAFALTENTLYTVEAYLDYLDHLTDDGIIAFQRYFEKDPQQGIRLVSVALSALTEHGVASPSQHIVVARKEERATVLVKKSPFTPEQVSALKIHCEQAGLELISAPGFWGEDIYGKLLAAADPAAVIASYSLDISPTRDDRPFFFYMVRPAQFWRGLLLGSGEFQHARAVFLLVSLLILVTVVSLVVFIFPAFFHRHLFRGRTIPALGYFGALGLGFMLVEIGMLQRMMLFLGHPTLALSVVLSSLLISAGLGSAWTGRLGLTDRKFGLNTLLMVVVAFVILVAFVWGPFLRTLIGLPRFGRITVAVLLLFPMGFALGTPFPLGLRRLAAWNPEVIPWAWAINGATSVVGSVFAMALAINTGFTAVLLAGAAVYLLALLLAWRTASYE